MANADLASSSDLVQGLPSTRAEAKAVGARHYFTDKPCDHGHVDKRFTSNCACVECLRDRKAALHAANPEKARAARSAYHKANREKYRAAHAAWYQANRERVREYGAAYYKADPEKARARVAAYQKANPEKVRARAAAWRQENPEQCREQKRNRRARKRGADGTCSAAEAAAIRVVQQDRCAFCRVKLKGAGHLDHIVPLARGGSNWPRNLQWLCQPCNTSKSAADPIEFARRKGKLL